MFFCIIAIFLFHVTNFATSKWSAFAPDRGSHSMAREELHNRVGRSLYKSAKKWPGGVVPYTIGESKIQGQLQPSCDHQIWNYNLDVTDVQKTFIKLAIAQFDGYTCVKFIPRTNQSNYLTFARVGGPCTSHMGMTVPGQQITMTYCPLSYLMHEMMHAIGFVHEHQREDRDNFVKIHFEKLETKDHAAFKTLELDPKIGKLPYDYRSLMHYASHAGKSAGTIIEPIFKDSYTDVESLLGTEIGFSTCDLVKINTAYECDANFYENSPEWCEMGNVYRLQIEYCPEDSEPYCIDIKFPNDTRCAFEPGKYLLGCLKSCANCIGECYDTKDSKSKHVCHEFKAKRSKDTTIECSEEEDDLCPMTCGTC